MPVVDGYTADFTRMFSIGELPGRLTSAYECARRAQAAAAACARRGTPCRDVYEAALAVARNEGLEGGFTGYGPTQVRFVGHGVGLELDELPVLSPNDQILEQGMVFALEPKFVFPGLGAIGIENTWVVGGESPERLDARARRDRRRLRAPSRLKPAPSSSAAQSSSEADQSSSEVACWRGRAGREVWRGTGPRGIVKSAASRLSRRASSTLSASGYARVAWATRLRRTPRSWRKAL